MRKLDRVITGCGRQRTLAITLIEIAAYLEFLRIRNVVDVTNINPLAVTAPEIATACVLEWILTILCSCQTTRRISFDIVIRQLAVDFRRRRQLIAHLQGEVVNRLIAAIAPAGTTGA